MEYDFENEGFSTEFRPTPEDMELLRESVLRWASERRNDARLIEGRAIGIAREQYIMGDQMDVPFFSERVRITPIEQSTAFSDLYLYFPYDQLGEDPNSHIPTYIFMRVIDTEGVPISMVVSKNKTAVFLSGDEMHVAMEHFDVRLLEDGAEEAIMPKTSPNSEAEHQLLSELLFYLMHKQRYRITSQNISDVA